MKSTPTTPPHRWNGWLILLLPLLIACAVLLLTETSQAAPTPFQLNSPSGELLFQQSQPACQTCHPEEYADWQNTVHAKAALDPVFKEQFAKSHNQGDCLKCHTTGFDKSSGKFAWEGVTCEACHGPYKQGHPAAQTMQLPMESTTCRVCHEAAFGEWEKSSHAQQKIECFDCHRSHTQGLRTGSAETLCAACHNNQQTQLKHSIHGIGGVDCGNCHMAKEQKNTAGGVSTMGAEIEAKSHSFSVPTDVCNRCHSNTIHPIGSQSTVSRPVAEMRAVGDAGPAMTEADRSAELEKQVSNLQKRLTALRDSAVISMGLALAFGGFCGLILGIAGMSLWQRSRAK
jgi:hypothetical protein